MLSTLNVNKKGTRYIIYSDGATVYAPIATINSGTNVLSKEHFDELTSDNNLMALGFFSSFHELNICSKYLMQQRLQNDEEVKKATILAKELISSGCSGPLVNKAILFLDILDGNLPEWMMEKEKTPLEKDNDRFLRKKSKLKLEYILEHGKKCEFCNKTFEPIKLCLVKKDKQKIGYSFDKVLLICKSCNSKR